MGIKLRTVPRFQVFDTNGDPLNGGLVYTYQPGTSTPKSTYTTYVGDVANANPVVLDQRGEATIYWDGVYKVVVKDSAGNTIYTEDNYGEGEDSVLTGNFNLAKNGSFELDTNADGAPDDWDVVEYTGGTVSLDSTEQIHGLQSLKFLSVGTGGGYATTDYFEVEGSKTVPVSFAIKASVATVHNQVDVIWYTAAKSVVSTTTLYNDTATNPTSWTDKAYATAAPATARFAKVRLYGCKDDDAQAGSTWFDNIQVEAIAQTWFPNVNAAVTANDEELNYSVGVTSAIQAQIDSKLPSASYTAADVLTKIKTVDGEGSGLDADTVDGLTIYSGAYDSLPAGWSAAHGSTGRFTVTHSFGTTAYFAVASVVEDGSVPVTFCNIARSANSFEVVTWNDAGVLEDPAIPYFNFIVVK